MKKNDTAPPYRAYLTEIKNGVEQPATLTGCTIAFVMINAVTHAVKINGTVAIEDITTGLIRYDWVSGDTDTVGHYQIHIKVTDGSGRVRTFPSSGYDSFEIEPSYP